MSIARETFPLNLLRSRTQDSNPDVARASSTYISRFDATKGSVEDRKRDATALVNEYYDICTDLYEYGWGQSFHFAPRFVGETFAESLLRYEHVLAIHGGWKPGMSLVDIGCGVGGPLRNMVRCTGAKVTGVNNNAYQIRRAQRYDERAGLGHLTAYERCDFNHTPFPAHTFDGAYAIEATCHAADRVQCFSEVFRILKPGAAFVGYDWTLTSQYDATNPVHRDVKHKIEIGDGLPSLQSGEELVGALTAAGFVVEVHYDLIEQWNNSPHKQVPWYQPLEPSYFSLESIKSTPVGRWCTSALCRTLEFLRIVPAGTKAAAFVLEEAAVGLVAGGRMKIFTPSYFFVARKPVV